MGVLGSSGQAGTDGPDRLVGDDDVGPVLDLFGDSLQFSDTHVQGLAGLLLLDGLTDTENDLETLIKSEGDLIGDELVGFAENASTFGVTQDCPLTTQVLDEVGGGFAGVGTGSLGVDVLGTHRDVGLGVKRCSEAKVGGWWAENNFYVRGQGGLVEMRDDLLDGALGAVHLEVTADKESSGLFGVLVSSFGVN